MNPAHLTPGKQYHYKHPTIVICVLTLTYKHETINHWAFQDTENENILLHKHQIETHLHEITT